MTLRVRNANIWTRDRELHGHFCQLRRVSYPLPGNFFHYFIKIGNSENNVREFRQIYNHRYAKRENVA